MQSELDNLSYEIEKINDEIKALISQRLCLEGKVIDIIGQKNEGTKTCSSKFYKTSTVAKVTRTFDKGFSPSKLEKALGKEVSDQLIKPKYELITSAYRELTPEQQAILSEFITVRPAKTSIKINRIEVS